jgi:CysZ protein
MNTPAKKPIGAAEAGALGKAFGQLTDPRTLGYMLLILLCTVVGAILLWWGVFELLTGWRFFNWAWVNWLVDSFTGVVVFFVVLLLFPVLIMIVTGMFLDPLISAVERRHYPHLPPMREQSYGEIIGYLIKFTLLLIALNLLVLPLYLLFPAINFVISWTLNGYLVGREFYEMVAMRRLPPKEMNALRVQRGGKIFSSGFLMAIFMTIPFLNLIMPVVASAYFTHIFHTLWQPPGDGAPITLSGTPELPKS